MDKEVLKKFNDEVFATMPDEPYLGPVPEFRTSRRRTSTVDWCFRAAAVVLAGLFIWALSRPDSVDPLAFTAKSADVYTVANGVRSRVTLPDSSTVWLNCGSELLVADDFEEGNREVSLKKPFLCPHACRTYCQSHRHGIQPVLLFSREGSEGHSAEGIRTDSDIGK